MIVLALDTTARKVSCAVASGSRVIHEMVADDSRPVGERVPANLMELLGAAGLTLHAVDVFAVATGPGSFTGLRIGIATMQGLSFAMGKPLVGVSGLDALARAGAPEARGRQVATWVDAWRGEVYAALYEANREVRPPVVAPPETLLPHLSRAPTLFIGDGALQYRDVITTAGPTGCLATEPVPALAGRIAELAAAAAEAGDVPPPEAIRPLYVRRADAELAKDARLAR